jgi:hypothetical protein
MIQLGMYTLELFDLDVHKHVQQDIFVAEQLQIQGKLFLQCKLNMLESRHWPEIALEDKQEE